jgi:glyoxylase-like metal-dependent hydrolase (beta-lactamase superfamily II)
MEILPDIHQLKNSFVNLYLIIEDDGLTLIDSGLSRSGPKLVLETIQNLGRKPGDLKRILITHSDPDHTGGAAELKRVTGASILASQHEAEAMAQGIAGRPANNPVIGFMMNLMMKIPPQRADDTLKNAQILPVLDGLQVIATPGHTPGHLSFYLPQRRVLFAGDSLMAMGGKLNFSDGPFTWNLERGKESVRAQSKLDVDAVCCGHGPVVRGPGIQFPFSNGDSR